MSYDDPITADSPITRPRGKKCVLTFDSISLSSFNYVWRKKFIPPADCIDSTEKLSKVILDVNGSVAGLQFDRYGALWLDGIEILRTTTPEPSEKGISWHIEKDLTEYSSIFREKDPKTLALSIPNVVNTIYTGILHILISLTFYLETTEDPAQDKIPEIIGLNDPTKPKSLSTKDKSPWSNMMLNGDDTKTYSFKMPLKNTEFLYLDLYASAHGNEEFWNLDAPGGSPYRQIMISIDGQGAGIANPYPVVYTGGIDPLLWRPLTGILSFNIPPYRFNLSPFAGVLNDAQEHTLSVNIIDNTREGVWYVNPVLVAYSDNNYVSLPGKITYHLFNQQPLITTETIGDESYTHGTHNLEVSGYIFKENQRYIRTLKNNVESNLMYNDKGFANGTLKNNFEITYRQENNPHVITHNIEMQYPYRCNVSINEDLSFPLMNATVDMARNISHTVLITTAPEVSKSFTLQWSNVIDTGAWEGAKTINGSLTKVYGNGAKESFVVLQKENDQLFKKCSDTKILSSNGRITTTTRNKDTCMFSSQTKYDNSHVIEAMIMHNPSSALFLQHNYDVGTNTSHTPPIFPQTKQVKAIRLEKESDFVNENNLDGEMIWMTTRAPKLGQKKIYNAKCTISIIHPTA